VPPAPPAAEDTVEATQQNVTWLRAEDTLTLDQEQEVIDDRVHNSW
jgi:hypothetical protein